MTTLHNAHVEALIDFVEEQRETLFELHLELQCHVITDEDMQQALNTCHPVTIGQGSVPLPQTWHEARLRGEIPCF